jgi:hypothetical protein
MVNTLCEIEMLESHVTRLFEKVDLLDTLLMSRCITTYNPFE